MEEKTLILGSIWFKGSVLDVEYSDPDPETGMITASASGTVGTEEVYAIGQPCSTEEEAIADLHDELVKQCDSPNQTTLMYR